MQVLLIKCVGCLDAFECRGLSVTRTPAEQAVESRNFLSNVLRSIKPHVYAFDQKGHLLQCNHSTETYFGINEADISAGPGDSGGLRYTEWLKSYPTLIADIEHAMKHQTNVDSGQIETIAGDGRPSCSLVYSISPLVYLQKNKAERHDLMYNSKAGSPKTLKGFVLILDDISEKTKMKGTLERYMNKQLVNDLLNSGVDCLGGKQQKVTVLFSDIRDFTSISESMDAAALVSMLNEYFGYQIDPILANNGVLDKFIGDAIMATFGVPFSHGTDTRRACSTALQMIQQLARFNLYRQRAGKNTLQVGIGLNTGKVISGNIGALLASLWGLERLTALCLRVAHTGHSRVVDRL